jgi:hypothetical protein
MMALTEKQLHKKRRNKKLRRAKNKAKLTPEQIEDKEIAQMEKMMEGQSLWSKVTAKPQSDKFEESCPENSDTQSSSTSSI